ncbi:hypothetical protein FO519_006506 [Halicephalobus sp. NKZ332]|nr:hypothetical protein FO519_006506 [Halicephalobus sp. NKZ332]
MAGQYEIFCDSKISILPHQVDTKTLSQRIALEKNEKDDQEPFFVVNLTTLIEKFSEFTRELPNIKPFYAVKSSDDPVILTILSKLGCAFDCASEGEISKVLNLGITDSKNVIYANPCKTKKSIRLADAVGINMMTFDNVEELSKVKKFHKNPEMILRIAVNDPTAQCHLGRKFGCDPEEAAPELLQEAKKLDINVTGISFHVGSGCHCPETFETAIRYSRNLFDFGKELGHPMKILDIGGGFPGFDTEEISFAKIADVIRDSMDKHFPDRDELTVIAEPGRFFACSPISKSVNIISSVKVPASRITKDESDSNKTGLMYFINQGIFGTFNCRVYDNYFPTGGPLFPDPKKDKELFDCLIWGPTCDGMDQVEEFTKMRQLGEEEWLYYPNMGAYSMTTSSTFNGFEKPKSFYFIDEFSWKLIRDTIDK